MGIPIYPVLQFRILTQDPDECLSCLQSMDSGCPKPSLPSPERFCRERCGRSGPNVASGNYRQAYSWDRRPLSYHLSQRRPRRGHFAARALPAPREAYVRVPRRLCHAHAACADREDESRDTGAREQLHATLPARRDLGTYPPLRERSRRLGTREAASTPVLPALLIRRQGHLFPGTFGACTLVAPQQYAEHCGGERRVFPRHYYRIRGGQDPTLLCLPHHVSHVLHRPGRIHPQAAHRPRRTDHTLPTAIRVSAPPQSAPLWASPFAVGPHGLRNVERTHCVHHPAPVSRARHRDTSG
ncbi:hypothetical protein BV25DRAFT_1903642 [Artomyces pyxidatus]|uniref:Uncharacterized protein n=1 Tax=Artomyces pyxidatus TaxID=48021 RepID=A0ACB8SGF4_9AGAM|nr:hypothetical protein BV25DRAFT_1903642 [Artomyces pyxidatus]